MKNLYTQLNTIREKNREDVLRVVLENQSGTNKLLKHVISEVTDYLEANKYNHYNFRKDFDEIEIHCTFDISTKDKEDSFRVSTKYYNEMCNILCSFVNSYNLGAIYWHNNKCLRIGINCPVKRFKTALKAYKDFASGGITQREEKKLFSEVGKIDGAQTHIEDTVAEDLFADYFEKIFLDKHIRGIISDDIASTNIDNFMKDSSSRKIDFRLEYVSSDKSYIPNGSTVIPQKYFEPMWDLVERFVRFYKIGETFHRIDEKEFSVHLNCSLDQLMNVYYMEKQRISYVAAGKPVKRTRKQKR